MKILVLGAGKMGLGVAFDLVQNPDVKRVVLADINIENLKSAREKIKSKKLQLKKVNVESQTQVRKLIRGFDCVVSAVTYVHNLNLTKLCIQVSASGGSASGGKVNFCDMGGNVFIVEKQLKLDKQAQKAGITVIPDCGLAPGMMNIIAGWGANKLDRTDEIKIRVGGLPQNPKPPLNYQLVFSVEGLINEYIEKAQILKLGQVEWVDSLTDVEEIRFPDPFGRLEAFYTSGGTSTLPLTMADKVQNIDYKTIRYRGHCEKIKFLFDLGLFSSQKVKLNGSKIAPRQLSAKLLTDFLSGNDMDVVLARVSLVGEKNGKKAEFSYQIIDYYDEQNKITAMQRTTAYPVSIIAQMLASGKITHKGVVPQEISIPADEFITELDKRGIKVEESFRYLE